jgi:hypothetical protein
MTDRLGVKLDLNEQRRQRCAPVFSVAQSMGGGMALR